MGRVKLKIKKLESTSNRQVTYSKRRNGILKKARELSILCDIDIILLMFSPTGKPTLFRGEQSNIEEVIAKFSQLTPQERAKRKLESLEALKKTFKKLDHDVNIKDYLGTSTQSVEELNNVMKMLHAQLTEVHKRLSCWTSPDKIDNIEHLGQMEDSLRESLDRIQIHKHNLTSQFQNGKHFSLMMGGVQEAQYTILPGEPNFIRQRDVECSSDAPLETFSSYFGDVNAEIGNMRQVDDTGQEAGASNELGSTACLRLEVNEQYPYPQYSNLGFPEEKKYKPETEMNFRGNHLGYQIDDQFELSRPGYESIHHTWVPSSAPCPIAMFNENSYPQQPN